MQDQDAPPVEEGETGGGVDAVPEAATRMAGRIAINATAFTPHQWITATVLRWPVTITTALAPDGSVPALRRTTLSPSQTRCPCAKTPRRESSASLTTSSSRRRFRK